MGTPSSKKRDGDHIDATSNFEYGVLAYSYIEYQIVGLLYNVLMQYILKLSNREKCSTCAK